MSQMGVVSVFSRRQARRKRSFIATSLPQKSPSIGEHPSFPHSQRLHAPTVRIRRTRSRMRIVCCHATLRPERLLRTAPPDSPILLEGAGRMRLFSCGLLVCVTLGVPLVSTACGGSVLGDSGDDGGTGHKGGGKEGGADRAVASPDATATAPKDAAPD